ncbi:sulfurtransferase TusA family protein [Psychrosphaera ytuae]|uniref:Sulfurtransferase TusA family protein n=1 Tax=Psychrosphaera ytuae TaxID=2820710 RepID=A0A975DC14_9GAMM|nr:sulfurtransferase TusA family protein [Psychrosphaera ytuae]QTH64103.1 sulfurtransferase TusA family protein [Psychrosphaera ytuae]
MTIAYKYMLKERTLLAEVFQFDAIGLRCPLAFVLLKKHLLNHSTQKFLLDDKVTLYNFKQYMEKQHIDFDVFEHTSFYEITIKTTPTHGS